MEKDPAFFTAGYGFPTEIGGNFRTVCRETDPARIVFECQGKGMGRNETAFSNFAQFQTGAENLQTLQSRKLSRCKEQRFSKGQDFSL